MAITPGTYVLLNVANTGLAMDTQGATSTKGANVRLYTRNDSDGQLVSVVSYGSNYVLRFALTGMVVDVKKATIAQGQTVQQYTWNKGKGQQWTFVDAGEASVIDGSDGRCYYIRTALANSNNYEIEAYGSTPAAKTDLDIAKHTTANDHKWIFVPKPTLKPGTYRFLSAKDMESCLGLSGKSGDINVYVQGEDDTNLQRWKVTNSGDNCLVESVSNASRYMTPINYAVADSAVVQIGRDSTRDTTKWLPVQAGTVKYNGNVTPYYEFRNFGSGSRVNYVMDVQGAANTIGTRLMVYPDNNKAQQGFVAVPETTLNTSVEAPSAPGAAASVGGTKVSVIVGKDKVSSHPAWIGTGEQWQLRYRTRKRLVSSGNDVLSAWTPWTSIDGGSTVNAGWGNAAAPNCTVTVQNGINYAKNIARTVNTTDQDKWEVQYQVRRWVSGSQHGPTAATTYQLVFQPTCAIQAVGWGAAGLGISYGADQQRGSNTLTIYEVSYEDNGEKVVMFSDESGYASVDVASSGSVVIPTNLVQRTPAEGTNVNVSYRYANVDGASSDNTMTVPFSVYQGSLEVAITNLVAPSKDNGWMLHVETDRSPAKLLLEYEGMDYKTYVSQDGTWDIPALYGKPYTATVLYEENGEEGSVSRTLAAVDNPHAYVFSWDGGWFVIKGNIDDYVEYTRSYEADYDAQLTNSDSLEVVHFTDAQKGGGTVAGAFAPTIYNDHSDLKAARELLAAHYAWLRPPDDEGECIRCAITSVEFDQTPLQWSDVQVSFRIIDAPEGF